MLLPAILSISVIGVPYFIISLWYYIALQCQQKKQPVQVVTQHLAVHNDNGNDLYQNKEIENGSEQQIIIINEDQRNSIEPLNHQQQLEVTKKFDSKQNKLDHNKQNQQIISENQGANGNIRTDAMIKTQEIKNQISLINQEGKPGYQTSQKKQDEEKRAENKLQNQQHPVHLNQNSNQNQDETDPIIVESKMGNNQQSGKKKTLILAPKGDNAPQNPSVIPDFKLYDYQTPQPRQEKQNNHYPADITPQGEIKGKETTPQGNNHQVNQQTTPNNPVSIQHQERNQEIRQSVNNQQNTLPTNQQAVTIPTIPTEQQSESSSNFKQYRRIQNIFLLISCIVFIQSIIGRIYVKSTKHKIESVQFFSLSAITAGCVLILYNCIYSAVLCVMGMCFNQFSEEAQMLARFCFVFYGLAMTFPIYAGLDDFITLDFVTSIIAIIYSLIIQFILMKIQKMKSWPTYIAFGTPE